MLVPTLELARISSLLNRVSSQASVASIAGLGIYVGKGPTASRDNDENIEGRMGSITRTSVQGGPASEALLWTPVPAVCNARRCTLIGHSQVGRPLWTQKINKTTEKSESRH